MRLMPYRSCDFEFRFQLIPGAKPAARGLMRPEPERVSYETATGSPHEENRVRQWIRFGRAAIGASFLMIAAQACGGGSKPPADFAASGDLAMVGTECIDLIACIQQTATPTAASIAACVAQIPDAASTFAEVQTCGLTVCTASADGGADDAGTASTAACASMSDTSAACVACQVQAWQSFTCTNQYTDCTSA
jgi:hypothetical protein